MRKMIKVEEAKGVCKDHSKWKEVISATPMGNERDVMYVDLRNILLQLVIVHCLSLRTLRGLKLPNEF
jgi:hypothetical protein